MKLFVKALSINKCWQGRRFKTQDYKEYEKEMALELKGYDYKKINHFVDNNKMIEVKYQFYLKEYKKTDVGNLEKPLTDILVANGFLPDDRFIQKITLEKYPSTSNYIIIDVKGRSKK